MTNLQIPYPDGGQTSWMVGSFLSNNDQMCVSRIIVKENNHWFHSFAYLMLFVEPCHWNYPIILQTFELMQTPPSTDRGSNIVFWG